MNHFVFQADPSATRLRLAVEESALQRHRLKATVTRTHALVDEFNRERQTIVPDSAVASLSEAKQNLAGKQWAPLSGGPPQDR